MTREEFINKLQECYFGNKTAFDEIMKYFDSMQEQIAYFRRSIGRKKEQIADWQSDYVLAQLKIDEAIEFINNDDEYTDNDFEGRRFQKDLLQILERTDK